MDNKKSNSKHRFVGRSYELKKLAEIAAHKTPALVVIYGRRRVGKTELIHHAYEGRNLLKFEGVEDQPQSYQRALIMQQLAEHTKQPLLRDVRVENWIDVFKYIYQYVEKGTWTVYFEELQWLAEYKSDFVSELKYAWDNYFRKNPQLLVVLCGSATSFMIKKVVYSKALYNRSQHEIHLQPFDFQESRSFFERNAVKDIMDAYLCLGGIPEYLNQLKTNSSLFLSLCDHSFKKDGFFSKEYNRIFISHFATNKYYKKIIEFLSKKRFSTREEIIRHLGSSSGGSVSDVLEDLELCGFIQKYAPYHLSAERSVIARYSITDNYLQFYYKFIHPNQSEITKGEYNNDSIRAINIATLQKWLGYSFERYCRYYHKTIAQLLGFSGVKYRSGVYYSKATNDQDNGFQIDLIFDRDDNVVTVCEIKYLSGRVSKKVISEFEKKLELLPLSDKKMLQKVLITTFGVDEGVITAHYFDRIITLDELVLKE